jgi:lipopolysaccharide export system permease protein
LNMVLAGLSLAAGNARRNSSWNLVYALLVFVVYFNLLSLSQNWVTRGKLGLWPALALVHGGLTLAALLVVWWRDGAMRPGRSVQRKSGPAMTAQPTKAPA